MNNWPIPPPRLKSDKKFAERVQDVSWPFFHKGIHCLTELDSFILRNSRAID